MFKIKFIILFVCAVFGLFVSDVVDHVKKCSLKDDECLRKLYQDMLGYLSESGNESYGLPAIDPFILKNISISPKGILNFYVSEGTIEGIKKCKFDSNSIDIDKQLAVIVLTCPALKMVGKYEMKSSEFIKNILGNDVTGNGNAIVAVENVQLTLETGFSAEKRDGVLYFKLDRKEAKHDIQFETIKFQVDNVKMGDKDVSEMIVNFLNENAKGLLAPVVKYFTDTGMNIIYDYLIKLFDVIPGKDLITEDEYLSDFL